jgi:peptidoglycan/LPS O-acetylase OafA/YrhL
MSARPPEKQTIGVLYGLRALMVLFVCNFHIWQQGWLSQSVTLFGTTVGFDFWTRSSYVFVDGMMLLSGFLLYLPYARQTEYATPVAGVKRFYWNRLARIVPSYLAAVLIALFCFALPSGAYRDAAALSKDMLTHLTFTYTFFLETYLYTPLNVVLWTVAIEIQFYLVFPLLARAVRRRPAITLCAMAAAGLLFRLLVAQRVDNLSIWLNQMPAFLDVYALGMLGAMLYVKLQKALDGAPRRGRLRAVYASVSPALFLAACWALVRILQQQTDNGLAGYAQLQLSQWELRLPLACAILLIVLSAAFLPRPLQKPLDNRLMRFLAVISYNLYIWHQFLSIQIAKYLFPSTLHSDAQLQKSFTLLCYAVSILAAMAATYGIEQPAIRLMERARSHFTKNREKKKHERSPNPEAV